MTISFDNKNKLTIESSCKVIVKDALNIIGIGSIDAEYDFSKIDHEYHYLFLKFIQSQKSNVNLNL